MKKGKLILLFLWMGVIFYFSSQNGAVSQDLSDGLLSHFYPWYSGSLPVITFVKTYGFLFRKLAHFLEFAVLGVLLYWNAVDFFKKNALTVSCTIAVLCGILDEVHQYFVSDRAFRLLDIMVDGAGGIAGALFLYILMRNKKKSCL